MDSFLEKGNFTGVKFYLIQNGINEENFFEVDTTKLFKLLENFGDRDNFMLSYLREKESRNLSPAEPFLSNNVIIEIVPENDQMISAGSSNIANLMSTLGYNDCCEKSLKVSALSDITNASSACNIEKSNRVIPQNQSINIATIKSKILSENKKDLDEDSISTILPKDFEFKKNKMYHFLNEPSNSDGGVVLGKYKRLGILDMHRLKQNLIQSKFREDFTTFKIDKATFKEWYEDFKELFPTIDPTRFFFPYANDGKEVVSAGGAVYNHYKYERHQRRIAGLLDPGKITTPKETRKKDDDHAWKCLTDSDRFIYTEDEISNAWNDSFKARIELINPSANSKQKPTTVESYFKTFLCICRPFGLDLLVSDYNKIIIDQIETGLLTESLEFYKNAFSNSWLHHAHKVIQIAKSNKTNACKEFVSLLKKTEISNSNLSTVSLLSLVWAIVNAPKKLKVGKISDSGAKESKEITLTKAEIGSFFILHVQDSENLQDKQIAHEKWIRDLDQELLPYIIFFGSFEGISKSYVAVNSHLYEFTDPVRAVEECYKCLTALNSFPKACDFIWNVIEKGFFKVKRKRHIASSSTFLDRLNSPEVSHTVTNPKKKLKKVG